MNSALDSDKTLVVVIDDSGILTTETQSEVAHTDMMSRCAAEEFARRIARYREADQADIIDLAAAAAQRDLRMSELLEIADLHTYDPRPVWEQNCWSDTLEVPLGTLYRDGMPTGQPYVLNIGAGNTGSGELSGQGPHWLIQGQSGSGKSLYLEYLLAALCQKNPPDKLSVLIIDFKGKASFFGFDTLPHTVGMVSDTGDPEILARIVSTLLGEIERRKNFLEDQQNLTGANQADIGKYLHYRRMNPNQDLPPLPILLVAIDETEIMSKKQGTEFDRVFFEVAKQGRSVGVWLIAASQDMAFMTAKQNVVTEFAGRASLVMDQERHSTQLIGVTDACKANVVASTQNYEHGGHIFFRLGKGAVHLRGPNHMLQTRRAGTTTVSTTQENEVKPATYTLANTWDAATDRRRTLAAAPGAENTDGEIRTANSELPVLLDRLSVPADTPMHNMWTPPLRKTVTFAQLQAHNALAPATDDTLMIPLGITDWPWKHRQTLLSTDFTTNAGNLLIAGTAKSGRTMTVSTAIIASAFRYAPKYLSWLIIDQGGDLAPLRNLPSVAGYARRGNPDLRDRLLSEIMRIINLRTQLFARYELAGPAEYFTWRVANPQPADPYHHLFVAIDGWVSLKNELNKADETDAIQAQGWVKSLGDMIESGRHHGVHMIITTDASAEDLPPTAQRSVSTINLRGATSLDMGSTAKTAIKEFPENLPGLTIDPATVHGADKHTMLRARIAVPIQQDIPEPTPAEMETLRPASHTAAITKVCEGIAAAAEPAQHIPRVRLLPPNLPFTTMWPDWNRSRPAPAATGRRQRGITLPIGMNGTDNTWAALPAGETASPHAVILGRPQMGRTTALTTLALDITATFGPREAKFIICDERGDLNKLRRFLARHHYLAGYLNRDRTQPALQELHAEILTRIGPDPDNIPDTALDQQTYFTGPEIFVLVDNIDNYRTGFGSTQNGPAELLAAIIRTRPAPGIHIYATTTHDEYLNAATRAPDKSPIAALEESRAHIVSLSAASTAMKIRGNIRAATFPVPGRGYLISDRIPAAPNGRPPIIQIAHHDL